MTRSRPPGQYLHYDDYPETLRLLAALTRNRAAELGLHPGGHGSYVGWDTLEQGKLSTTQRAVARLAHALALIEGQGGGLPPGLAEFVIQTVTHILDPGNRRRP